MKIRASMISCFRICLIITATLFTFAAMAQNPDTESLKKKMTSIRQSTNWKDKEQAAKANEEIRSIAKQLMMLNTPQGQSPGSEPSQGQMSEENVDLKMKLWEEIWKSARGGENADLDLAKPLREQIVEEYKEDSDHSVKNGELMSSMSTLYLNMSMPGIEMIISQMPQFKNIKTLVIICEDMCMVDLEDIFSKASEYNLEQLYILNFKTGVTNIPESLGVFTSLKELSMINNGINQLPESLSTLTSLENLYLDVNPVVSIKDKIAPLHKLKNLGIKDTRLSEDEILNIQTILPNCSILR